MWNLSSCVPKSTWLRRRGMTDRGYLSPVPTFFGKVSRAVSQTGASVDVTPRPAQATDAPAIPFMQNDAHCMVTGVLTEAGVTRGPVGTSMFCLHSLPIILLWSVRWARRLADDCGGGGGKLFCCCCFVVYFCFLIHTQRESGFLCKSSIYWVSSEAMTKQKASS